MGANGDWSDRPVLVTGGAGYVGSQVVRKLLARGRRVRVLDRFLYGDGGLSALASDPKLEIQCGDVRDVAATRRALGGVGSVIALAALVGGPLCDRHRREAREVNLEATILLGRTAREAGIRRVVFSSTCSVYGDEGDRLIGESSVAAPSSLYAQTRWLSEEFLLTNFDDIGPVVLRLATVFGLSDRMRFDLVVNAMTARAVVEGVIPVSNGFRWRPFVHVRDAALAFVDALDAPARIVAGRRFNVGANHLNHTLAAVADVVAKVVPNASVISKGESGDARSYRVRFNRIKDCLGFRPEISLEAGVVEIAVALRDGRLADYRHPQYHNALSFPVGAPV